MANTPLDVRKSGTTLAPTDIWPDFHRELEQFFGRFGGRGGFPGWPAAFDTNSNWSSA